ncbi:MAG TPA: MFS transporter [Mycobacteriales bacterium]|nr:MFS transporter [Mycobacteriales bacterium]
MGDLRRTRAADGRRRRAGRRRGARTALSGSRTTAASGGRGYLQLLREEKDFRRVYISQIISLGGDWFALIPLLTLLGRLTDGGLWGGLVLAVDTAVFALLAPYAGTVADRFDRRRTMVIADFASAAMVLLLLLVRSESTAWIALVAIAGVAVAKSFFTPASSAALPNIVPPEDLARATVLGGAVWGTMLAVGAAAGGLVALLVGARWCFALDAVSFVVSGVLVMRTTKPFSQEREKTARVSVRADVRETIEYARGEPRVRALLACKFGVALGNGTLALFPLYATRVFSAGDLGTGLLYSARGFGALIGPFFMRRFITRDPALLWPVLASSIAMFGLSYLGFAVAPVFALGFLAVALAHFGGGANWVLSTYGLQAMVPDHVRGRVFSADYMLATLAISVSQIVAGVLSESVAVRTISAGLGAVVLGYAVGWWALVRPARRSGRLDLPADAGSEPSGASPTDSVESRREGV